MTGPHDWPVLAPVLRRGASLRFLPIYVDPLDFLFRRDLALPEEILLLDEGRQQLDDAIQLCIMLGEPKVNRGKDMAREREASMYPGEREW